MEPKLAFCYSAAIIAEIIALALQIMIMQKNLPVLNREVKKISTTFFLVLLVILNIIDFLIVDVNIPVAKQIDVCCCADNTVCTALYSLDKDPARELSAVRQRKAARHAAGDFV